MKEVERRERRGRPSKPTKRHVTLNLETSAIETLDRLAREHNATRSEVVQIALGCVGDSVAEFAAVKKLTQIKKILG